MASLIRCQNCIRSCTVLKILLFDPYILSLMEQGHEGATKEINPGEK